MKTCKTLLLFAVIFLFSNKYLWCQNLFDEQHSAEFANYLFTAGQYQSAYSEFSRLTQFDSLNADYRLKQIQSLRLNYHNNEALQLARKYNGIFITKEIEKEYFRLLIFNAEHKEFGKTIPYSKNLNDTDKFIYQSASFIFDNRFSEASKLLNNKSGLILPQYEQLLSINNQCLELKLKNPLLSGLLSALIPGSGKVYSGYWQDGALAFLYTGMSVWQTYRGFKKYGNTSIYGWISAGLSAGFYFGNIYGSVKAANKYNHQKTEKFHQQLEELLINY